MAKVVRMQTAKRRREPPMDINIKRGEYKILRVNGTEELVKDKASLPVICKQIGCDSIDTVTLDREREIIMLVDDTGMIDGKPVNHKATNLYHSVRNTPYSIHGDVAIVNDCDFA